MIIYFALLSNSTTYLNLHDKYLTISRSGRRGLPHLDLHTIICDTMHACALEAINSIGKIQ